MYNKNDVKISIVIPVYNSEEFLAECLTNVLRQSLKEIEVLCVDDGSTDDSPNIIREFAKKNSRVVLLTQENLGAGPARNLALKNAVGEYIAFMDSDDQYPDINTLEKMYKTATEQNVEVVGGYRSMIIDGDISVDKNDPLFKIATNHPNGILIEYADVQFDFNYQAYIYKRELIQDNNITFPDYRRFQDPPFFVKTMIIAQNFFLLSTSTYLYRWGHQNIRWNARKINDLVKGHIDNLKISKKYNLRKLHATTCQRLEGRYKDMLLEQFDRNNIELFSLLVYANYVSDFSIVEEITGKKRKVLELATLGDFRKRITMLLNESCTFFSEKDDLLDIFEALVKQYEEVDTDNSGNRIIINELINVMASLYSITVSNSTRMALLKMLESNRFAELGWLQYEKDFSLPRTLNSIDLLQNAPKARQFERSINAVPDTGCKCVHDTDMAFKPKVSVIIPVYDVERYLPSCLNSVLAQTLKEIEIICVDDGSPDNSIDILNSYAEKFSNIKIIQQRNGGLSSARNTGIRYATGEYLHFLDSDDTVKINTYEELYKKAKEDKLDMLFFDAEALYETDELAKKYPWYKTGYTSKNSNKDIVSGRNFYINGVLSGTFRASACLYLLKAELIEREKLTFKEGVVHEDNLFTNCCVMLSDRVSHISAPFLNRLVREGSISIRKTEFRHAYGYFSAFIGLYHFVNQKVQDDALKDVAYQKMKELIQSAEYSYEKIEDSHQKDYYLALPAEESTLFYSLIVAPYILKIDRNAKGKELEKAINKAVNSKITVDAILEEQQRNKKQKTWHVSGLIKKMLPFIPKPVKKLARKVVTKLGWRIL